MADEVQLWRQLITSAFAVQLVFWAISALLKSEKLYDLVGSGTYIYIVLRTVLYNKDCSSVRQKVQAGCVLAWAFRLGSFLFYRVIDQGRDRRFDEVKTNPLKYLIYWMLQGLWISVTLYPSIRLWEKYETVTEQEFVWRDWVGFALWLFGFVLETTADVQKLLFKKQESNRGKWIDVGVWRVIRHPNYFGELTMWWALWLTASATFRSPWEYATALCPLFNAVLIIFISGIPPLTEYGRKKWGHLPEYQEYLKRRKRLVPFIW